jgi:CDGSH-type Zn-finger protein
MHKLNKLPQKQTKNKIQVTRNGPYLLSGGVPPSEQTIKVDNDGQCHGWKEGKKYSTLEKYALCRCGRSKTKPFCDGTHVKNKFDGTENATCIPYLEQANEINGPGLKLTDVEDLCAGSRFCERAGGIWDLTEQSDNPNARQIAIEEAFDCPSGRLVVWEKKGKAIEPVLEPSVCLVNDPQGGKRGPIWVRGGIPVVSVEGTVYEIRNRVTICRCGKSSNKPFCDGSHLD